MPQDHFHHLKIEEAIYAHAALEFFFHDTRYSWFFRTFWCFLQKAWIFFFFTKKLLLVSSYLFLLFACTSTVLDAGQIITGFPPATWHAVLLHRSISWLWVAIGTFFQNLLHYKDLHKNTLIYTCRKARWAFLLIFFLDSASSFIFSFSFWITSTLARCPGLSLTHEHLSHKLIFF